MAGTPLTGWRKIANAAWSGPADPQIYGALELDATAVRAFLAEARAAGHHVTATHIAGRAIAYALARVPDLNVRIVGGRAYPRPSVDIFFITAVGGGHDLSGVKVAHADARPAVTIARELEERSKAMKAGRDPDLAKSKSAMDRLPLPILRVALRLAAFVAGDLAMPIPMLGLEASPFGSAMVSSVGMLGIPVGFSPLMWMYKVPLLVLVGEMADKPVAIDGRVEVRPVLPITATIDHRYADGWHLARVMSAFKEYIAAPARFEPAIAPPVKGETLSV